MYYIKMKITKQSIDYLKSIGITNTEIRGALKSVKLTEIDGDALAELIPTEKPNPFEMLKEI